MPELPEVETVCRVMRGVLVSKTIDQVEVVDDSIVLCGLSPTIFENRLQGAMVKAIGRKGKFWWLELKDRGYVCGHLGMSGWIRELGQRSIRLREHGSAPFEDESGRPRFLKMQIATSEGRTIAFTDGRRLGRLWLSDDPHKDKQIAKLGPDVLNEPRSRHDLAAILAKRKAPIKALLLDQSLFAGVGNWIADEVLYHAGIAPARLGSSLSPNEVESLAKNLLFVVQTAVDAGADSEKYPDGWLFTQRWGGGRGPEMIDGQEIRRETIGGRTTAWVPTVQK